MESQIIPQRISGIWEGAGQKVGNNEINKRLSPSIDGGSWEKCQVTAGPQWQAQRVSGGTILPTRLETCLAQGGHLCLGLLGSGL